MHLSLSYFFILREFVIPVDKQGVVKDLLEEAREFVQTIQTDRMKLVWRRAALLKWDSNMGVYLWVLGHF